MQLRLCRPSVLAAELNGSFSAYRPRIKEAVDDRPTSSPAIVAVDGDPQGRKPPASHCGPYIHRRWSDISSSSCASGVAISAWALFPSTVERGIYVPPPEMAPPSAADVNSAGKGLTGNPLELARADFRLMEAKLDTSTPTMYGSATVWYPSPAANVSVVSVRSKLQALLMLLYSQSGDVDPAALEAKLQALLTLPDSVLAQLMEHPDLADLNKMLDAVFLGKSDLSGVKTELDKIEVTSVPAPTENIDVVTVNGNPAYIVHSPVVQMATENVAGSPVSALPPPPAGPVTVVSLVQAPASLSATAFAMPPTSAQLPPPPAPAAQIAALTLAPTSEQLSRPPAPASVSAPASVQESAQNSQTGSSGTSQTGSTGTSSGAASQGGSGDGSTKSDDRSTGSGNPPPDSGQGSQGQGSQGPGVTGIEPRVTGPGVAGPGVTGIEPRVTGPRVTGPGVAGIEPRVTGIGPRVTGLGPRVAGIGT